MVDELYKELKLIKSKYYIGKREEIEHLSNETLTNLVRRIDMEIEKVDDENREKIISELSDYTELDSEFEKIAIELYISFLTNEFKMTRYIDLNKFFEEEVGRDLFLENVKRFLIFRFENHELDSEKFFNKFENTQIEVYEPLNIFFDIFMKAGFDDWSDSDDLFYLFKDLCLSYYHKVLVRLYEMVTRKHVTD